MSLSPKASIKLRLKQLGMTQHQLAELLGLSPAVVSTAIVSSLIRHNSHWPAILDALGLEVVVRPKQQ